MNEKKIIVAYSSSVSVIFAIYNRNLAFEHVLMSCITLKFFRNKRERNIDIIDFVFSNLMVYCICIYKISTVYAPRAYQMRIDLKSLKSKSGSGSQ